MTDEDKMIQAWFEETKESWHGGAGFTRKLWKAAWQAARATLADHSSRDAVIARWNEQPAAWQETDVYWKPIDSFSVNPDAFAYKRPLYAKPTQK